AFGNFKNQAVHVNVAGKIEIQAAPFDLRPGTHFLILRVVDRIALDHWNFAFSDPVAIKVALDAAAAADVRWAELFTRLLFLLVFLLVYRAALRRRVSRGGDQRQAGGRSAFDKPAARDRSGQ